MSMNAFYFMDEGERDRYEQTEKADWRARAFQSELDAFDSDADVVLAKPGAVDITAGYWHLRRRNRHGFDTYQTITTPEGAYREPDLGVIAELRRQDLWNPEYQRRQAKLEASAERAKERQREDRQDAMRERVDSTIRTSVRF